MPIMDGIELFEAVRKQPMGAAIPFIFLTARGTREDIFAAKSLGADDYITKPITSQELLAAVRARLQRTDELMLAQLKAAYKASLSVLANAIEARDRSTRSHVVREAVLCKTGRLNPDEWEEMRQHPEVGARMIERIPYLARAVPVVLHHHERWDGSGYPNSLQGEAIPLAARLLSVADTYDAMTSDRPYRAAASPDDALNEIIHLVGVQFDPAMVEAFRRCWERGALSKAAAPFSDV
jgi:putative two-component system response regulator